ncbi:MAG: septal ring lytic transglycosylase RlpA family protein [Spirochaetia bacterium]
MRISRPTMPCLAVLLAAILAVAPVATVRAEDTAHELEGYASWYGGKFQGRLTANGEVFDTAMLTAAHKTLPFGTIVEVTHLGNFRTVEVRINDRGPFVEGRVIDLSRAAADALDMAGEGVAPVRLKILWEPGEPVGSIQVGSFQIRANAEAVALRLTGGGIEAVIETRATTGAEAGAETPADSLFRVVVPAVPESSLAVMLDRLREIGFSSVLVRTR